MNSEKILFCYREDKVKKPVIFDAEEDCRVVAAIPCSRSFFGKKFPIRKQQVKRWIAESYEKAGAEYFWLEEELCEYLQMKKMDLPEVLLKNWLERIPFFHTLIFADDEAGRAIDYIPNKTDKLAIACVVCFEKYRVEYENLAIELFQKEGIVLQVLTYGMLEKNVHLFQEQVVVKGRAALLDFDRRRSFWDRRLKKDIGYYSFWNENRLFLDTFKKNRYNTLTK